MHVLVVDDSAVVRHTVSALLAQESDVTVDVASDPFIAMNKMAVRRPDVMLLDIEMPRMDGLTFLRKIMSEDPIPIVICSAHSGPGLHDSVRALEYGAIDVVGKPRVGVQEFLYESSVTLLDALRGAARAQLRARAFAPAEPVRRVAAVSVRASLVGVDKVIAIGASTGGTDAIRELLVAMPPDCPGLVIVQHMPEGFTTAFARRLNELCAIEVREAKGGDEVRPGLALIAPGNRHMRLDQRATAYVVRVEDGPLISRHRPSVDALFESVARVAREGAVGVILTGMGDDGANGLLQMKRAGARTIAQDEKSSVVFGMPNKAIARGAAEEVLPLGEIAGAIVRRRQ
ncbi:MAG TPA: chemotaxis response regulator protein-glutamate methylesterase [Thermoanaerobaculia bacterium]|nr:chemotaxis response regulator protein-glutamate methylesterase [Thermoanaerobaculia bacterium]